MATIKAWHEAYPSPRTQSPPTVTREELLQWLQEGKKNGLDLLLVDLRRTDHEVNSTARVTQHNGDQVLIGGRQGSIRGSINLPAQSLYHSLPTLSTVCQNAGIKTMIWYCGKHFIMHVLRCCSCCSALGSSRGRGTRAAGWFQDLLDDEHVTDIKSTVLLDGVAGWARAGDEYTQLMQDYDAGLWSKKE